MKTTISNKIHIEDPTQSIITYCKNELTLSNPQYNKLLRMGKWTGGTPQKICLYEKNGNALILPFGTLQDIWQIIFPNVEAVFAPKNEVDFAGYISLYDYQLEAVEKAYRNKNGVVVGQCGCGKTQIGIGLIQKLGQKALWLTHTKELLNQSKDRYIAYFGKNGIGEITEGKVDIGTKITFATVQTMSKLLLEEYADCWNVVVVDECHRLAGSPTSVTMFYKVLSSLKARYKYGLTATSHRSDGLIKSMYAILGKVIHEIPKTAVSDKTMKATIKPVNVTFELPKSCFDTDGTVKFATALNEIAFYSDYIDQIVGDLKANSDNYCLILSDRLDQLRELKTRLNSNKAVMIDGTMTSKTGKIQRKQAIELMQQGKMNYLFASYNLAKEGLDIPRLNRLFLATPKKDKAVVIQSVGRVSRTFEGKTEAIVYDYVHSNWLCQSMYKHRQTIYKNM